MHAHSPFPRRVRAPLRPPPSLSQLPLLFLLSLSFFSLLLLLLHVFYMPSVRGSVVPTLFLHIAAGYRGAVGRRGEGRLGMLARVAHAGSLEVARNAAASTPLVGLRATSNVSPACARNALTPLPPSSVCPSAPCLQLALDLSKTTALIGPDSRGGGGGGGLAPCRRAWGRVAECALRASARLIPSL